LSIAEYATATQQGNKESAVVAEDKREQKAMVRFYEMRQRIYGGLLVFVVVVGLPIIGVPSLRERLSQRVMEFKRALSEDSIVPVTLKVGENKQPFPIEYDKPAPVLPSAPNLPPLDRIFTLDRGGKVYPAPPPRSSPSPSYPRASAGRSEPATPDRPELSITREEPLEDQTDSSDVPKYKKGQIEQSAYDLLLKTYPAVAKMVQGEDPGLQFKSWDAASRGDDVFWVRLKFQSKESSEAEYIWIVKMQSNQVTPFNYNAREIS
jgi:hypothetical protein